MLHSEYFTVLENEILYEGIEDHYWIYNGIRGGKKIKREWITYDDEIEYEYYSADTLEDALKMIEEMENQVENRMGKEDAEND